MRRPSVSPLFLKNIMHRLTSLFLCAVTCSLASANGGNSSATPQTSSLNPSAWPGAACVQNALASFFNQWGNLINWLSFSSTFISQPSNQSDQGKTNGTTENPSTSNGTTESASNIVRPTVRHIHKAKGHQNHHVHKRTHHKESSSHAHNKQHGKHDH